jgi:hypothetical protein
VNWFHFYCSVRTFSSCVEATLTVLALLLWPLPAAPTPHGRRRTALALASLAAVIRPTAAVLWTPLVLLQLHATSLRAQFLLEAALIGCVWAHLMRAPV